MASDMQGAVITRADDALYRAKQLGRNCICWHNGLKILPWKPNEASASKPSSKPATLRQSKPTPLKTLNSELTRSVCDSRQFHSPLSLVCMRIESCPTIGIAFDSNSADCVMPIIHSIIGPKLKETDRFVPVKRGRVYPYLTWMLAPRRHST